MPGRGSTTINPNADKPLRRPGTLAPSNTGIKDTQDDQRQALLDRIKQITSPDDLQLRDIVMEVKSTVTQKEDLVWLVDKMCDLALADRKFTPVAAKIFGLTAHHQAGGQKLLSLLMNRLQDQFSKKDEQVANDRKNFVTSAFFLGEAYHHVKTDKNCCFNVLAGPAVTYMDMILAPHTEKHKPPDLDEEMLIIARLLLQNGVVLYKNKPSEIQKIVQNVSEVLCCHELRPDTRLNLLAALADLIPHLAQNNVNLRILHASLASKIGVSLHV